MTPMEIATEAKTGRYCKIKKKKKERKKKKVDVKASKGRKLRFVNGLSHEVFLINLYLHEAHEKLQSFMVPVSVEAALPVVRKA